MFAAITILNVVNVTLVTIFLFLVFKFLETNWSYKISKPHAWDAAVKAGLVSKKLRNLERFYRDKVRFYSIWLQIQRLKNENVPGAFAEVGVYRGETARMIHAIDSDRAFHLFDTFEGFDDRDLGAETRPPQDVDFSDTQTDLVLKFIEGNENILIHKGYFPETASETADLTFAFVHLDADLYQPTLAGLQYFYPRLSAGGVIIIHDYNHTWDGVKRAVNEFLPTIPEKPSLIADWQGSMMLVKNGG